MTHVSRYWRGVALSVPLLWSRIRDDLPLEMVNEFLHRSKTAGLAMRIHLPSRSNPHFPTIGQHWARIVELELIVSSRIVRLVGAEPCFVVPAPKLKSLVIWSDQVTLPERRIDGLQSLLSCNAPHLRQLIFRLSVTSPWLITLPSGLTHLTMEMGRNHVEPTWSQLSDALQPLYHLEDLYLKDIKLERPPQQPLSQNMFRTKKLSRLRIRGDSFTCSQLPTRTSPSPHCSLLIEVTSSYDSVDSMEHHAILDTFISQYHKMVPARQTSPFLTAVRLGAGSCTFEYVEYSYARSSDPFPSLIDHNPRLGLCYSAHAWNHSRNRLFQRLFAALTWDGVDRLDLSTYGGILEDSFRTFESLFQTVQAVSIDCSISVMILETLHQARGMVTCQNNSAAFPCNLFPSLRYIHILSVSYDVQTAVEVMIRNILDASDGRARVFVKVCREIADPMFAGCADVEWVGCSEECLGCVRMEFHEVSKHLSGK